ncbi:Lactonase, 7-bladed beta-propeller-domain-containing protein [Globomyces pollinis-pini]|nr:Lactonase, 7-bladed beta-propeller-domain-containing protein [Globomyces pollinis-pini]
MWLVEMRVVYFFINFLSAMKIPQDTSLMNVYVGAYTNTGGPGLTHFNMDPVNGSLQVKAQYWVKETGENPTYLTTSNNKRYLYACGENNIGTISTFEIDSATKSLKPLNVFNIGISQAVYIQSTLDGQFLAIAHYSGHISIVATRNGIPERVVDRADFQGGSYGIPSRQEGPHVHSVLFSKDNQYLYAADLGNDKIYIFKFNLTNGKLSSPFSVDTGRGSGPRHLTINREGNRMYLVNELSNTLVSYDVNQQTGSLSQRSSISTLNDMANLGRQTAAAIRLSPNQDIVYISNRGIESDIVSYKINPQNPQNEFQLMERVTTKVDNSGFPRDFNLIGDYIIVGNQNEHNLITFRMAKDGFITRQSVLGNIKSPVSIISV